MKQKEILYSLLLMPMFLLGGSAVWSQSEMLTSLRCEQKENPTGVDTREPRFSWKWKSNKRNLRQSAYEIRVSENRESMIKEPALEFRKSDER
jgi:alpha-L-rhamnosidase